MSRLVHLAVIAAIWWVVAAQQSLRESEHVFVFVGGSHYSGSSTVERILSSQYIASGFRTHFTIAASTAGCLEPSSAAQGRCSAPDNEGIFLTKAFSAHYTKQGNEPCVARSALLWGLCSEHKRLSDADVKRAGGAGFRNKLLEDWGQWWNSSKPYLVEKVFSFFLISGFCYSFCLSFM
jgi:hypothetical protein